MIKDLIKRIPWWGWIIIAIVIIFLLNYASSLVLNRSLFNMALDNLRKDQAQALEDRDEQLKLIRQQNRQYQEQIKEVQKEKEVMKQRAIQSEAKVSKLEGENDALRKKIDSIVVSDDPDHIIDDLNKAGFKSIKRKR